MKRYLSILALFLFAVVTACGIATERVVPAGADGSTTLVTYDCNVQDPAGLQAAEDSLTPGATLMFSGTCAGDLTLQPNTTLAGDNSGSVIDGSVIYSGSDPVTIRDIRVVCGTENACLDLRNGWRMTVTGVVTEGGTYGVELSAPPCAKGSGCNVNDYFAHDFIRRYSSYGFYVNDPANTITDGYLINSWVTGGTDAVHITNAAGWSVSGNHIYGNSGLGIYANRLYGSTISDNLLEEGGETLVVQKNSQPSVVAANRVSNGPIKITSIGTGCFVTVYGNISAGLSYSGCTYLHSVNIVK